MYVLPQDQADCLVPEAESCRLCGYGDPVGNFVDLLDISSEGLRLSVCQHLDVQVCSGDGRSSKLCEHCRTRLEDWMQFYNKCRVFQQVLHTPSVPVNEDDNQDVDRKEDVAAVAESVSKHLEELVEELVREGSVVNDASVDITRDANDASQQRMAEEEDVYTEGEYEDDLCSEEANEVDDEEYSAEDKYGSNPSSIKHRIRQKKFTFTIPFLERKVNRKFSPAERAKLQKHISKRQNTLIYESLIGGGPNQLWNCQICDKVLRGRSNEVKKHYIKVHQSQPILPCHVCDYTSRTEKMYQAHRMSHLVEYPCAHCGKIFTQHSRLVYHMNSHTNERQFECELCDKKFNTAQYVKTHKRKVHGDQEKLLKYTCELCGMRFKYKNHLQYHQKRHPTDDNPLPYSCKYCQERFVTRAEQLAHSNTVHAGEGEYVCHLCGKKMKTILSLENHVKLHSGVKEFKCGQCGAAFATNHSLKCHKKIHERNEAGDGADGMGGYSCPVCKKTMSNKSSLNQHLKTHMGTKPYQCQHCAASYVSLLHNCRISIGFSCFYSIVGSFTRIVWIST